MTAYHKKAPQPFTFMTALNFSINVRLSTRADFNDGVVMDGVFSSKFMFAPNLYSSSRSMYRLFIRFQENPELSKTEGLVLESSFGGGGANARLG